jgi:outer membrane protein assembly factor BamB
VIEEGRVYLHFGSYGTACLDTRTAEVIWSRRDLPCRHFRGPGSSPILFGDLLIIHYDGFDVQYAVALDKRTGETIWKKDRVINYGTDNGDFMKAYSTPLVINYEGRPQLVSPTSKATLVLDPRTGNELWRIRYDGYSTAARPLYGHGLLFINGGFPKGEIIAVRPGGSGDVTQSHIAWREKKSMPSKPSSLLIGVSIFSVDDAGVATCLDAKTGKVIWAERVGGEFSASPVFVDGRIYLFSHAGITTVIAPERQFRRLATNELENGFRASPAIAGKAFYLRTERHLYRIEQAD